jgi:hypothetical protein
MSRPNPNTTLHKPAPKKKHVAAGGSVGGGAAGQAKTSKEYYATLVKGIVPGVFPATAIEY